MVLSSVLKDHLVGKDSNGSALPANTAMGQELSLGGWNSKALAAVKEIGLKAQADPQGLNSQPLLHSRSAV